ncbi:MAG: hypothetical protein AB7Q23_12615 [Hyphomonadaceae bacterium]
MRRVLMAALAAGLGLAVSACAPSPVAMHATTASELLTRFATGGVDVDVCTPRGRAMLRGAVRAYGAAMTQAGEIWPVAPAADVDPDTLKAMDVSVVVAVRAGFVEASDLPAAAREQVMQASFADAPALQNMRAAAPQACAEVFDLQRAAARFVMETERYKRAVERAVGAHDARTVQHLRRQAQRVERAQSQMDMLAAAVSAAVARRQS